MTFKRRGILIKEVRQAKGLTQDGLAKKAGIHPIYLAQIEGSTKNPPTRTPSLPMLGKLAKVLKVKVAELLE